MVLQTRSYITGWAAKSKTKFGRWCRRIEEAKISMQQAPAVLVLKVKDTKTTHRNRFLSI